MLKLELHKSLVTTMTADAKTKTNQNKNRQKTTTKTTATKKERKKNVIASTRAKRKEFPQSGSIRIGLACAIHSRDDITTIFLFSLFLFLSLSFVFTLPCVFAHLTAHIMPKWTAKRTLFLTYIRALHAFNCRLKTEWENEFWRREKNNREVNDLTCSSNRI